MALKKIAADSVHRICSGQVVLTLAIAVKELVENSLDAGATSIEIRLKNSGIDAVEVIDNGSGIRPENYEALTLKHFTSKISDFSDVAHVETFGFRGEALSSLCALSNLVVVTRHGNQAVGSRIEYDSGGRIKQVANCAREIGTTVILSNLFHTLPVRQKEFHRNIKKEYGRLVRLLQGYCLITENIKISCYNQNTGTNNSKKQLILSSIPSNKMVDNISCVFGPRQVNQLMPFSICSSNIPRPSSEDEGEGESPLVTQEETSNQQQPLLSDPRDMFNINGYVSKCTHGYGRSTTDRQFFFLNGRPCDHSKLSKTVNEVYHSYNRHQYPFVCLNIATTSRDKVDVNLTPDKRTVLIQEEKLLLSLIKDSLIQMFEPMQSQIQSNPSTPCTLDATIKQTTPTCLATPSESVSSLNVTPIDCFVTGFKSVEASPPTLSPPSSHSPKPLDLTTSINTPSSSCTTNFLQDNYSHHQSNQQPVSKPKQHKLTDFGISKTTPILKTHEVKNTKSSSKLSSKPTTSFKGVWSPSTATCSSSRVEKENVPNKIVEANDGGNDHVQIHSSKKSNTEMYSNPPIGQSVDFDIDIITARHKELMRQDGGESGCHGDSGCHGNKKYFHAKIAPDSNKLAEDELKKELNKEDFKKMEIIGQFNLGFIIAKLGNHLFIIDQHATDEKYNYERLQRDTVIEHQTLIQYTPLPLELTVVGESVVLENEEIFAKNGFRFTIDENAPPAKRVKLIGQPVSKNWSMGVAEIEELIFLLTDYPGEMVRPSCVNKMFAMRACRGSIMIGTSLNHQEMSKLLQHMSELNQPWNCPHGRPTLRHLIDLSRL